MQLKPKTALICYGLIGITAIAGYYNQAVLILNFVILVLIALGVSIGELVSA